MARGHRSGTKLEILKRACHYSLTDGYTNMRTKVIAKDMGISIGNLAFHYPTKEDLLVELIKYLCDYHLLVMEHEVEEGKTSLLAYLLELTSMMAICDENEVAKDLYVSAYTHSKSLTILRKADTEKAKMVFSEFCPEWRDEDFSAAENVVSGIEYASLMKEDAEDVPLEKRITTALNAVMKIYEIPKETRYVKIAKVLARDYKRIGRKFIEGFINYVEEENEKALQEVLEAKQLRK